MRLVDIGIRLGFWRLCDYCQTARRPKTLHVDIFGKEACRVCSDRMTWGGSW